MSLSNIDGDVITPSQIAKQIASDLADEIIEKLWGDLANRAGFDAEIDVIGPTVKEEIRVAWHSLIMAIIYKEAPAGG